MRALDNNNNNNNNRKEKKMKTTFTQKIDNYLEKTHGTMTLLATIGAIIGTLFALGMSSDYGVKMLDAFGVVFFLVMFGAILGALGAYIIAEKIGEKNVANTARALHNYYNAKLEKVETDNAKLCADISRLENGVMDIREALDYGATSFTYSASAALLLGTLDQAFIHNYETVYPLRNK